MKDKFDWSRADSMTDADVQAAALSDADAQPLEADADWRPLADAPLSRRLRHQLGVTRAEFAERYQIPIDTICEWEREDCDLPPAAELLLKVIAADPDGVAEVAGAPQSDRSGELSRIVEESGTSLTD